MLCHATSFNTTLLAMPVGVVFPPHLSSTVATVDHADIAAAAMPTCVDALTTSSSVAAAPKRAVKRLVNEVAGLTHEAANKVAVSASGDSGGDNGGGGGACHHRKIIAQVSPNCNNYLGKS